MIMKRLKEIMISDIQELIDNGVGESRTIEYKSELHLESGDERKEFLADVSSFANTEGGDLIYGIREDVASNLPIEVSGIQFDSDDKLIRKIESLLRDSVSPRIPEIDTHIVKIKEGISVLILRVGISSLSPHRVVYKGHDKFYARNSKGKYPMDVTELRSAFNMSQELTREIEQYKTNRLDSITKNYYHELLEDHPIFTIQAIPLSTFRNSHLYSVKEVSHAVNQANATAFGATRNKQITIDGVKITSKDEYSSEIAHFMTNGIVELATTLFFYPKDRYQSKNPQTARDIISSVDFVNKNFETFDEISTYYQVLDASPPIIWSCAITKGKGYCLPSGLLMHRQGAIDRDVLLFPDVIVENFDLGPAQFLKPVLDSLWNACGYLSCPAYSNAGEYVGLNDRDNSF